MIQGNSSNTSAVRTPPMRMESYYCNHGQLNASNALERVFGSKSSNGVMKSAMSLASFLEKLYFSISTSWMGQNLSVLMFLRLPFLSKKFLEYRPSNANRFGTFPSNSWNMARWSSSLSYSSPALGSNRRSPVSNSKVIQPSDHMSADVSYLEPIKTSGARYCLVWMSSLKCRCVQHAFPRSTMTDLDLTRVSKSLRSGGVDFGACVPDVVSFKEDDDGTPCSFLPPSLKPASLPL
mmetsp:Transcript_5190/g.13972  ORF Transcript_5190/g.13972 Transcript_5190/m.13972 type:complete len:236 (-) Transcript_5190:693-1400(-)